MGIAELGLGVGTLAGILVSILSFVARGALADLKEVQAQLAAARTQIAVMEAVKAGERITKLEEMIIEVRADVHVIRAWVDDQKK